MADLEIQITDIARQKFVEFLEAEEDPGQAIRLAVAGHGPHGFNYQLDVVNKTEEAADHIVLDYDGFNLLVEQASAEYLGGVTIDFAQRGLESGFMFDNPNSRWKDPVAQAVQDILDTQINPGVASHGGFITLLDVKGSTAFISLGGGCQGCGMADVTLKQGIEVAIIDAVEEIDTVLDTTDHAAGENPYYQSAGGSPFA
ncbi:MAG: iron-sulfur cluster assembly accessory protein [Acidobacteriota bacterium]